MKVVALTTARRRRRARPVFPIDSAAPHLLGVAEHGPVGLIFGREEWGLRTEEMLLGDWWVTIPMATSYPSLNLAQSVMLVCKDLAQAARGPLPTYPWNPARREQRLRVLDHAVDTMGKAGLFYKPDKIGYEMTIGRLFDRGLLEDRDIKVFHGLFHQMDNYIRRFGPKEEDKK